MVGTALCDLVLRCLGLMVRVLLSEGARDASPGCVCELPWTAAVEEMAVVSRRLSREVAALRAVWGRAGKVKVGRLSRGREVIIIKQPGLSGSALALTRRGLF
jgi:hypothetical protein